MPDIQNNINYSLFNTLKKQRELSYKYYTLKERYTNVDETLSSVLYELKNSNEVIIKHLLKVLNSWLSAHATGMKSNIFLKLEDLKYQLDEVLVSSDVTRQVVLIEKTLASVHHGGPMINYFGLTEEMLNELNTMNTSAWDKQVLYASKKNKEIKLYHPGLNITERSGFHGEKIIKIEQKGLFSDESLPFIFWAEINVNKKTATINEIRVNDKLRNKKIAASLLDWFINACNKYGVKTVDGYSLDSVADKFWKHMGFKFENENDNYIYNNGIKQRVDNHFNKNIANVKLSYRDTTLPIYHPGMNVSEYTDSRGERVIFVINKDENIFHFDGKIFPDSNTAHIGYISTHYGFKGKKIARSILDWFIDTCKKYSVHTIDGMVLERAVDFWKHMGFEVNKVVRPDSGYSDLQLKKQLTYDDEE